MGLQSNHGVLVALVFIGVYALVSNITSTSNCKESTQFKRDDAYASLTRSYKSLVTGTNTTSTAGRYRPIQNEYLPSPVEKFVIENADGSLQLDGTTQSTLADGCRIWKDPKSTPHFEELRQYRKELHAYNRLLSGFRESTPDLRHDIRNRGNHDVCDTLELVPGGLSEIFNKSGALSMVGNGGGFVEPLLPPLRSQEICFDASVRTNLLSMAYLIQDFASLCRKLQPHSRIVFVDMGAALDFHRKAGDMKPAVYITHMYQRFGFHFDHIYAFEMKPKNPVGVYSQIPDDLRAAYHWFNVGVDADPDSRNNPFNMLLEKFNEDDFIVVKLGKT